MLAILYIYFVAILVRVHVLPMSMLIAKFYSTNIECKQQEYPFTISNLLSFVPGA